jgi:hypothetical protein
LNFNGAGGTSNGPIVGRRNTPTDVSPPGQTGAQSIRRAAQHADQVYPFDVTLIAQNEYGRAASSAVIGVEIINEGGGISVDDITNEQQMTYIAITKMPWIPLTPQGPAESLFGRITSITPTLNNNPDQVILNQSGGRVLGQ